jgi:hypothetical protein
MLLGGTLVADDVFDRVYPPEVRRFSREFWTPVDVGVAAARLLGRHGCQSTLDVGAGAGKFCIVASLLVGRRTTGLEHRSKLVDVTRRAAAAYGAQVECLQGDLESVDAARFDSFYFFNPFAENLFDACDQLDDSVELSEQRCHRDLSIVERWLEAAPAGTHIITYHGLGGRIPATFELERSLRKGSDHLRLWTKRRPGCADGFYLEMDEVVLSSAHLRTIAGVIKHPEQRARIRALLDRPLGSVTPQAAACALQPTSRG